ncbi:MAG: HAD hydrolase-like protein [Clostridiales bacterium]|nr:HAD hydrolase-like protein [Clostridiales bacterium]
MGSLTLKRKIALIGPMGSGKSNLCRRLTQFFGYKSLDTDKEFVNRYGSIPEFFSEHGEAEFRKIECEILKEAARSDVNVIATGGGAVLNKQGMNALRSSCDIVYLTAPIEVLKARIAKSDRPLKNDIERIMEERSPLYNKYADYIVDSSVDSLAELEKKLAFPRRNRYDILLVDSDDTILDFFVASAHALKKTLETLCIHTDGERAVELFRPIVRDVWARLERGEITRDELFVLRESNFGAAIGVKFEVGQFTDAYRKNLRETQFVREGAIEFLKNVRSRGISAYIITNADVYCASNRLKPVLPYVDGAFISEEAGYAKPDARYFDVVFKRLNFPNKNRIAVFGDSESSDIAGGVNYGLDTVLYAPNGAKTTAADFTVTSYDEFLSLL